MGESVSRRGFLGFTLGGAVGMSLAGHGRASAGIEHISDPHCHTSSIAVSCSAKTAFAYVSDGLKHSDWTLGSMDRKAVGDHLYTGTSIFDRTQGYIRLRTDPENFMVYADIGASPDALVPKNIIRVTPGVNLGRGPNECLVTLMTWRAEGTSDQRWFQVCSSHDAEMFIIRNRLEREA